VASPVQVPGCYACEHDSGDPDVPLWERLYVGSGWRIAHAFNAALPGWLVLLPRRHVLGAQELTSAEAVEFGALVRSASIALVEVTGCLKTYVALFAEAEGFAHLHVHLVPRYADTPPDRRGPAVFGYLGAPPDDWFGGPERDDLARRLAVHLTGTHGVAGE
jgi:diadenosine tetraphosphate (Ap4A) HIT family hydrolase